MTIKKPASAQPKVYLIDDDPVAMFLLVDLVESVDLPHVELSSAVDFLKQDLQGLEGCIVSDLRMPGMSGLELQDELHRRGVDLPIIFISAYAEVHSVVRAMRGGALDFSRNPLPRRICSNVSRTVCASIASAPSCWRAIARSANAWRC